MIVQLRAEISAVQLYTCSICGAKERGDTLRVTYEGDSSGLKTFIDSQQLRSSRMPTGWSFNGAFKCARHV